MNQEDLRTELITTLPISDLRFPVLRHAGDDYTFFRPLVDMVGLDWKGAKRAIHSGSSPKFFGIKALSRPKILGWGGDISPPAQTCIRLNRVYAWLSSVNVDKVRSHGNVDAADWLEAFQTEWADALHDYMTKGYAVRPGNGGVVAEIERLCKVKKALEDPSQRAIVESLINAELDKLGVTPPSVAQGALPLS